MPSPLPTFKAVIFDMDGLMFDSESVYHHAWQRAINGLGYRFDSQQYLSLVGQSNAEAERLMQQFFGEAFPFQQFRTDWTRYWQETVQAQPIPLKPGVLALLSLLEQHQVPKAVGTSSTWPEAELTLKGGDVWQRFAHIVTVDQVAAGKPAPDIFLEAAQRLSVAPQDCLVLEDSNAGVSAATDAGMTVVMVPDLQSPSLTSQQSAHAIVDSLHVVYDWVAETLVLRGC
ncbi:MAG: HAD family phosphatase [Leptolyngbya sp. SIO4C1]|nr:HAD family phosphatase [Leptolyngbya sp. SIO4C1]